MQPPLRMAGTSGLPLSLLIRTRTSYEDDNETMKKSIGGIFSTVLLVASTALAAGLPNRRDGYSVKESVPHPNGWVKHDARVPGDHRITLRIGLPQNNFAELERHLNEVSDPDHWRYGDHLSKEEVEALVAPHPESLDAVDTWLASHGISIDDIERSPAKDWAVVRVPVALAEAMLDTTYSFYTHVESGDSLVRTTSYSLPASVFGHVDFIQPTTMFARPRAQRSTALFAKGPAVHDTNAGMIQTSTGVHVNASCNSTITPECLKQLYNAVGYTPSATNGNVFAITGYLEQYINNADLNEFFETYVPEAVNSTYKTISINGGLNSQNVSLAGVEANLDSQYGYGITYPTKRYFYTTGGRPPFIPEPGDDVNDNEPYLKWLSYVLNQTTVPQTISTSYADDEQTVPFSYAQRVCSAFAQLGARGGSVMFSSGDAGVGDGDPDPATQSCFSNDGKNTTKFMPGFPPSCPYVTAVGATFLIDPEVAVSVPDIGFYSGGGFSDYFARPAYQNTDVSNYLSKLPAGLYKGLYNASGRAFPDVSAQGWNFSFFYQGEEGLVGGTSAAAPTFSSFVSLLNDARVSAGLKPLGFLNPLLYSKGYEGLNDITSGNNPGCGTEGFNATVGWDPVTGLGTPNFEKLKAIVLAQ